MKTVKVNLTQAAIHLHRQSIDVQQIRDIKYPLYFRFSRVDRSIGTFFLVLYKNNKDNWIKLGRSPKISAKVAYQKMYRIQKESEQRDEVLFEPSFNYVNELLAWYSIRIENNKALNEHTKKNQIIIINKHLIPMVGKFEIPKLNLSKIDEFLFQPLQQHYELSTIDNIFSTLNGAFKRALQVKVITNNPLIGMSLASFTNQRSLVKPGRLSHEEVQILLKKLKLIPENEKILVVLLLLHGTRIGETVKAKWRDFDFKRKLWRVPAKDTKNKKEHVLPLTETAISWLKKYRKQQKSLKTSDYLFPQKSNTRKPISGNQGSEIISKIANKKWSAHDIRKFARTWWMENGIDYMVGELLLNHTLTKIDKTYIQTLALNKCRDALEVWTDWLVNQGLNSIEIKPRYTPDRKKWNLS